MKTKTKSKPESAPPVATNGWARRKVLDMLRGIRQQTATRGSDYGRPDIEDKARQCEALITEHWKE